MYNLVPSFIVFKKEGYRKHFDNVVAIKKCCNYHTNCMYLRFAYKNYSVFSFFSGKKSSFIKVFF